MIESNIYVAALHQTGEWSVHRVKTNVFLDNSAVKIVASLMDGKIFPASNAPTGGRRVIRVKMREGRLYFNINISK